jgi:hypothetical protein
MALDFGPKGQVLVLFSWTSRHGGASNWERRNLMEANARTFWTSFFDGFTMAGIFGQARIPGDATRLFAEEPEGLPEYENVEQSEKRPLRYEDCRVAEKIPDWLDRKSREQVEGMIRRGEEFRVFHIGPAPDRANYLTTRIHTSDLRRHLSSSVSAKA